MYSYKGKSHQLGESILLPDQCGELVCEEGLVAEDSPLLTGAVHHNVTHPEELTLVFRPLHSGYGCCMLDNSTMVAPGTQYLKSLLFIVFKLNFPLNLSNIMTVVLVIIPRLGWGGDH